jgi:ribosomal-protein-serine acetyltransferase
MKPGPKEAAMFRWPIAEDAELRILEPRHAEALYALIDRNREHLGAWMPWLDERYAIDSARTFIERDLARLPVDGGFPAGVWAGGELAGVIGFHAVDHMHRRTSIGYWLGAEFQGRGLMTAACAALVSYAFDELRLNRIEIHCATENRRSRAIPERLGFRHEGTLKEAEWLHDHFVDLEVYAMLAAEWAAAAKRPGAHR